MAIKYFDSFQDASAYAKKAAINYGRTVTVQRTNNKFMVIEPKIDNRESMDEAFMESIFPDNASFNYHEEYYTEIRNELDSELDLDAESYANSTVDWQVRESVRAKLRILVRCTLQKYKYPPDRAPAAVELIMKQAEALSNAWSV